MNASDVLVLDADGVPTGRVRCVAGEDLRSGPPLGDRRLDRTHTSGQSPATVHGPIWDLHIEFDAKRTDPVVVHTPLRHLR